MKINIMKVKYNYKSNVPDKCIWYTWKEICDNCDAIIREFNEQITNEYPDTEEKDYCLKCMRKYIDDRIIAERNNYV